MERKKTKVYWNIPENVPEPSDAHIKSGKFQKRSGEFKMPEIQNIEWKEIWKDEYLACKIQLKD